MQLQTIQAKIMRETLTTTTNTFNTSKKLDGGRVIERNKHKRVNINSGFQPNTCWKPLLTLLPELDLEYHLRKIYDQHQQNPNNF